jgi:hypothetical protein
MSKPPEKLKDKHIHEYHYFPDTESIEELISFLQSLRDRGFETIERGYNYFSDIDVYVWQVREETDEEFEERVRQWQEEQKAEREKKKKYKAEREERERKEYERLSKKFGVTNEQ